MGCIYLGSISIDDSIDVRGPKIRSLIFNDGHPMYSIAKINRYLKFKKIGANDRPCIFLLNYSRLDEDGEHFYMCNKDCFISFLDFASFFDKG